MENNEIHEQKTRTRPSCQSVSYLLKPLAVLFSSPDFESRLHDHRFVNQRSLPNTCSTLYSCMATIRLQHLQLFCLTGRCNANSKSMFFELELARERLGDLLGTKIIQSYIKVSLP